MTYLFRLDDKDLFRDSCKDTRNAKDIAKKLASMYRAYLGGTGAFLIIFDEHEQEISRIRI